MFNSLKLRALTVASILVLSGSSALAGDSCSSKNVPSSSRQAGSKVIKQTGQPKQMSSNLKSENTTAQSLTSTQQGQSHPTSSSSYGTTGGPSAARPCKDLDDTNCYSLVTLECR